MPDMSTEQRDAFLAERRVAVLAIERPGKGPLCAPIWYRRNDSGAIEIVMAGDSAKARLLRRAGRATVCVQDEGLPYRYVVAEGPVTLSELGTDERDAVIRDIAIRYLDDERGNAYADATANDGSVLMTLQPERWRAESLG